MNAPQVQSIAITGCGWVTPFAAGTIGDVLQRLAAVDQTAPTQASFHGVPEHVLGPLDGIPAEARRERQVLHAAVALRHALASAALDLSTVDSARVGLAIGCALAGQVGMIDFAEDVRAQSPRFVSPIRFPQTVGNYPAGALARAFGLRGPSVTLASGTAGGLEAIREAAAWLVTGAADVAIAGGSDVFTEALAAGLKDESLPPLADGACLFVLERADHARTRGANPLGAIELGGKSSPKDNVAARMPVSDRPPAQSGTTIPPGEVVSSAGFAHSGAIYIEHWTGRALAASGAAAVAAALGAWAGHPVPLVSADSTMHVARIASPLDHSPPAADSVRPAHPAATILAGSCPKEAASVFLTVPSNSDSDLRSGIR